MIETRWPAEVAEVLDGDQAVAFAHTTPASGVVLTPLTNFGGHDAGPGRLGGFNSTAAMWPRLQRFQANPKVAIAFHTRAHARSESQAYVLVQGRVTHTPVEERDWLARNRELFERSGGKLRSGFFWDRWLAVFYWRVGLSIEVERLVVWPDLRCAGEPVVYGTPLPAAPAAQRPPAKGVAPRVSARRAAAHAAKRPDRLLGWVGADGYPVVVPVEVAAADADGLELEIPAALVPPGGRRAGLLAHSFARYTHGQNLRRYTGWFDAACGKNRYAPHTRAGFRIPASTTLFYLVTGAGAWRAYLRGRRAGMVPKLRNA
ncbi:hypothetical protein [Nocardia harenae]|uniref:hypothetical protein n=1 Tax=Nocardia harenae TaxID=358707 RepID=UPI0008322378|nr:hypothetical protein [Nocardia harenae]